jgi:hypothetical protein
VSFHLFRISFNLLLINPLPAEQALFQHGNQGLHRQGGSRSYVQQLRIYEGQTLRAGLSQLHGLRHAYAQQRYEELTGWKAPAAGGPTIKTLTPDQKAKDREARLTISHELGHEREQITAVYLGR